MRTPRPLLTDRETEAQRGLLLASVAVQAGSPRLAGPLRPPWVLPTSPLQFQGEWFVLGLAGSSYRTADRSLLGPFIATFELKENSRLEVSYAMMR